MINLSTDCSGIGAPEIAMQELGVPYRILFASEKDKFARKAYKILHPAVEMMFNDMKLRDTKKLPTGSDFYFAGIPCQTFSIAGNRKGELDPRGTLFYNAWETIRDTRPRFFIIENVKGLLSDCDGETFKKWLEMLAISVNGKYEMFPRENNLGYHVHWAVLNSMDYGVPQTRDRVFIVGLRDEKDCFTWPKKEILKLRLKDLLEPVVDEKYFVSEKAIKFITREDRLKKKYTQVNGDVALTLTAKGTQNWTGDFILVPEATKQGYSIAEDGDCINLKFPNSKTRRGRVSKGISQTIETTSQLAVVVPAPDPVPKLIVQCKLWNSQSGKVYDENGLAPTLVAGQNGYNMGYVNPELIKVGDLYESGADAGRVYDPNGVACTQKAEGGGGGAKTGLYLVKQVNGNTDSNGVQPHQQNRVYDSEGVVPALLAELGGRTNVLHQRRIRKLTPKEVFRLMGNQDSTIELLQKHKISDSQLYKMGGNSIVIHVIKAIIKQLMRNI